MLLHSIGFATDGDEYDNACDYIQFGMQLFGAARIAFHKDEQRWYIIYIYLHNALAMAS